MIDPKASGNNQKMRALTLTGAVPAEDPVPVGAMPDARAREIVVQHFDFVWRLLRRLGVPEADVDDAAQQVFIITTQRLQDIPLGSERTFLYGTALRSASTLRRNLRRRSRLIENGAADAEVQARGPYEELEHRRALALLDVVLHALEHDLREVFVLCEIEELSAPQVAGILRVPVGTVASRLRRARQMFTEQLSRLKAQRAQRARSL
ncbi:MAG: sigma-70 family RNA polymerase sigma factor [Polyangiaceae bacterium]